MEEEIPTARSEIVARAVGGNVEVAVAIIIDITGGSTNGIEELGRAKPAFGCNVGKGTITVVPVELITESTTRHVQVFVAILVIIKEDGTTANFPEVNEYMVDSEFSADFRKDLSAQREIQ